MKKTTLLTLLFLFCISNISAQSIDLKFNKEGKFKIIQIADTHFIDGDPESDAALKLIAEAIDAEKPDLLVFTGDMAWMNDDMGKAFDKLFAPVIERRVPWAYVFGNHDDEFDMTRKDIMDYVTKMPYCVARHGDNYLSGVGNYVLEIKDRKDKVASTIYCMDSQSYCKIHEIGGYAWFEPEQIDWYVKQSEAYKNLNKGVPMPSLAFFHIPLPEYFDLAKDMTKVVGEKKEKGGHSKLNSGMFTAMRMCGDIMGTFVGHDHDNDYIGMWYDICLAYGRFSGGNTVYNNLGKNGCRVIELYENKRKFDTHIYLTGGEKIYNVTYPDSFPKEKKK